MRHRIKHHVNRPVLHMGLFHDAQMLPAAGLVTLAAGWLYAGAGGLIVRTFIAGAILLPVGIMIVDNRVSGMVVNRVVALHRWYRRPGVFAPGSADVSGYELSGGDSEDLRREHERLTEVDLEITFTVDG
jgi:hypothetical protein